MKFPQGEESRGPLERLTGKAQSGAVGRWYSRNKSPSGRVRDCDKIFGLLHPGIICIARNLGQSFEGERIRAEYAESGHRQIGESLTPMGEIPDFIRHKHPEYRWCRKKYILKATREASLSEARFVSRPFQQARQCVRTDGANSVLSLLDFLGSCVSGRRTPFLVGGEIAVNPVAGYHIEPLRERETVVDGLVVAVPWWRDDEGYGEDEQKPNKSPEQGLSALPHVRRLA